jgi:hypothetical protein
MRDDQDQLDRIAEKREAERSWRDEKPTHNLGPAAPIHPLIAEILTAHGMPQRQPETHE